MKKLILTLILATFMSVSSVNADTYDSCFDEYKIADSIEGKLVSSASNYNRRLLINLPLTEGKTYYLKFWNLDMTRGYVIGSMHQYFDVNDNLIAYNTNQYVTISNMSDTGVITYTYNGGLENASYFHLSFYVYYANNADFPYFATLTLSEYELITCPSVKPEPEPLPADTTLDSFYSLYVSKIKEVSQYAIENKFLLGTVTLIILFIVLEIILKMFRKGGYR